MIRPEHQHRFEGDTGMDIASEEVDVVWADGARQTIKLRLGSPFMKDDQWWIRTELEHLDSSDGPIAGEGSLHTLVLGIRWIILRLESFQKAHDCKYYWKDTNDAFDYREFLTANQK